MSNPLPTVAEYTLSDAWERVCEMMGYQRSGSSFTRWRSELKMTSQRMSDEDVWLMAVFGRMVKQEGDYSRARTRTIEFAEEVKRQNECIRQT